MFAVDPSVLAQLQSLVSSLASQNERPKMRGIYKRGKRWLVNTTVKGVRHQKSFETEEQAQQYASAIRSDVPVTSVEYVVQRYVDSRVGLIRSHDRYTQCAVHLIRHLGSVSAAELRQPHVDQYVLKRAKEKAAKKTAWNELALLRSSLISAWQEDLLPSRPRFKLHKPKNRRTRVVQPDEMRVLLRSASELELRRVLLACWVHGFRRSEIIKAQWSWVNERNRSLTIPAEVAKNGVEEIVRIPVELWHMLVEEPRHPVWVFPSPAGRQWSTWLLRHRWLDLLRKCGVPKAVMHDLRRSMASVAGERGHGLSAVQANGRWVDTWSLTNHYLHASTHAVDAVAKDLVQLVLYNDCVTKSANSSSKIMTPPGLELEEADLRYQN